MRGTGYFLLNKEEDYRQGFFEHMGCREGGIYAEGVAGETGRYLTAPLDAMEAETEWHRLLINNGEQISAPFRITIYAADRLLWDGAKQLPGAGQGKGMDQVLERLQYNSQRTAAGASDILLHGVRGRYLWILLEVYGSEEQLFYDWRAEFPAASWIRYLPEYYQKEDAQNRFLERYLGIFQTIYEDINRQIDQAEELLDVVPADRRMLDRLADWLGVEEYPVWPEESLRVLLGQAPELFRLRGTREGILRLVSLYTGEEPLMVESWQLRQFRSSTAWVELEKLYSESEQCVCILVREAVFTMDRTREGLMQVIGMSAPAQVDVRLVVLGESIYLGGYSYIGINSILEKYKPVVLTEQTKLSQLYLG